MSVGVEASRAMAQVQAQVMIAKQFPRNQVQALAGIIEACKRPQLAESAIYSYPRGGKRVEGPSIRLAEAIAQGWGNIDFGVVELERRQGTADAPGESKPTPEGKPFSLFRTFAIPAPKATRR